MKRALLIGMMAVILAGCASMLRSTSLPLEFKVLDEASGKAVTNATVELQWRVGFQGYYWGRPVNKATDSEGCAVFSTSDVPPISSDGYALKGPIRRLFVSALVVSAPGFERVAAKYSENMDVIRLKKQ